MKILIAYEGSECSDAAIIDLRRAGLPAKAETLVLSVAEVSPYVEAAPYGPPVVSPIIPDNEAGKTFIDHELEESKALAGRAADRLRADFPGWKVETEAWVDAPGAAIVRKTREWRPDLIIVGSHCRSGLSRFLLGSVSQHVLHHASCSVRISRHPLHSQDRAIRLLIGTDGSKDATAAVNAVAARNWPEGTEAKVVGVMDTGSLLGDPIINTPEAVPMTMEEKWKIYMSATTSEAARMLHKAGLRTEAVVVTGKACDVLIAEAEKWDADCVFVGARGLNGLERLLLGSVSTAVSQKARCAVEIVRSPAE